MRHTMNRFVCLTLPLALAGAVSLRAADPFAEGVRTTEPLTPAQQLKTFHLPPGFEIQLVAAEPDLRKPMNMAFDTRGRLWVTESREYPYPAPLDKPARDTIRIFSDFDDSGRARKVVIFADGLNIPIGVYPYKDGCIAWSIPNIWFLRDTNNDGRCDTREILFGPLGYERDTHGNLASFRRGFDGWLYGTHGFNNTSTFHAKDGSEITVNSGNTYRIRLDGSRVEQHTWGQVNPFGLCFDELGNLYTADCHSSPIYQLIAGGYYPSFGKPHDGLGFAPTLMQHSHGSTAIAGALYCTDTRWPEEFRDNMFVGNVMTSRINRDRISFRGSTPVAQELPDFLTTDDPWFRPVDMQLGPDGHLYIADFYNRIIGHYEVPLDHPGRDRERGRIWRVVYRGDKGRAKPTEAPDLSRRSLASLINELDAPNLPLRLLAMNEIADRFGTEARGRLQSLVERKSGDAIPKAHALWLLQRLGAVDEQMIDAAVSGPDRVLRVHALRVLGEKKSLTILEHMFALAGLRDPDPFTQRAATDALASHPDARNVPPLLELLAKVPPEDTHLRYAVRRTLRDQLRNDVVAAAVLGEHWSPEELNALADVALAVKSEKAALLLMKQQPLDVADANLRSRTLQHIVRYGPPALLETLAETLTGRGDVDIDLQIELFQTIEQGLAQRGAKATGALRDWGVELTGKLLSDVEASAPSWSNLPLDGAADARNPWTFQERPCADGKRVQLMSSHPLGEQLTGRLRSAPFTVPSQLSFYLCGHDGFPKDPPQKKNFVRLIDAGTQQALREVAPPRNDTARRIVWDLGDLANRTAFVEVTDGDTAGAYAWLAIGRFEPALPELRLADPNQTTRWQQAAADIARTLSLAQFEPFLRRLLAAPSVSLDARASLARAVLTLKPDKNVGRFAPLVAEVSLPADLRETLGRAIASGDAGTGRAACAEALPVVSHTAQLKLAALLAETDAIQLLRLIETGKAPARLLLDNLVKERLAAAKLPEFTERLARLTKDIPPLDGEKQKLIDQRRTRYDNAKTSSARGEKVFQTACAACHQIGGQGGLVGPQLDGIGNRGLDRVLEDILDPNRNVDHAFRSHTIVLNDGDVVTGLPRREEGELLILADSTGKEISVPKNKIKERRESDLSLMPDNLGESLKPAEFNDLLAYLLNQRGTK
ncbi:MAG: PVC-type heme-binding CxxCH protein [Verrucomicrobiota bacterium]